MPDFNGETLIITLDSGTTEVNVERDLYSDWKEWLLETPNNRAYPQAFRTVGGDALTPGINAGAYFFIQNDKGWRIKPFEEDATILLTGNLAPEDSSLPILVPTTGDFSVLVAGLQPITQSVADILLQNQTIQYGGVVYVDLLNGSSGTEYPIGLQNTPVDNVSDAYTIANNVGARTFNILNGEFIVDRDSEQYIFINGGNGSVDVTGYDMGGSQFLGVSLTGTDFSASTSSMRFQGCSITNISNVRGILDQCRLVGTISLQAVLTSFSFCSSLNSQIPPVIDGQGSSGQLNATAWSGDIELENLSNSLFRGNIDTTSGKITLRNTCSDGQLTIRGVGDIIDQSTGLQINRDGFIEGEDVIQLREYIYIDKVDGVSGITEGVGTATNPVNNIQDAYTLSIRRKTKKFRIRTDDVGINPLVLDQQYSGYTFQGISGKFSAIIDINNQNVDEAVFDDVSLIGAGTGSIFGNGLDVINVTGLTGLIKNSGIDGLFFTANDQSMSFIDCFSSVGGSGFPDIRFNNFTGLSLQVRGYKGSLGIYHSTDASNKISFDVESGRLVLDSSSTAGDLIARGVGTIQDDTGGLFTINRTGFISAEDILDLKEYIHIDTTNGFSGTSENVGDAQRPSNNIADAATLAVRRGIRKFKVRTDNGFSNPIVLDRNFDGYTFEAETAPTSAIINLNGQSVDKTQFKNVTISGSCTGDIYGVDSIMLNVSGFTGFIDDCSLAGVITPAGDGETTFENTFTFISELTPTELNIDMINSGSKNIQFKSHGGDVLFTNMKATSNLIFDVDKGIITLDSTNTGGTANFRGIGQIIDNSSTTTINKNNLINPVYLEELHRLQGLNADAPMTVTPTGRTAGDIDLDITGDGVTTSTVTRNP